jgi:RNA polymerase sigma factor (sigma-70 family)
MTLKKDWVLNREAFDALLAVLDRDPERAGVRYEHLRRALITFFECRGCSVPDELTDDTMNRVARRLTEGQTIQVDHTAGYFYGVARNVLREYWESRARGPTSLEAQPSAALHSADPDRVLEHQADRQRLERHLAALDRCLGQLGASERELIRQYYQGETGVKIENRRRLAERLGIAINALRIRALRIREKLEQCVERRVTARQPAGNTLWKSP